MLLYLIIMLVCSSHHDFASAEALDFVCRGERAKKKKPHAVGPIVVFLHETLLGCCHCLS
jgi:hypothetical protein